jgi:hypothetical protein
MRVDSAARKRRVEENRSCKTRLSIDDDLIIELEGWDALMLRFERRFTSSACGAFSAVVPLSGLSAA